MHKYSAMFPISTDPFTIDIPDECPHCSYKMFPKIVSCHSANSSPLDGFKHIGFTVLQCAREEGCCKHFYVLHGLEVISKDRRTSIFLETYPRLKHIPFDDVIFQCSPKFINTYNGAYEAEQNDYFDLAGAGYRMALEFLTKDFIKTYLAPDDANEIASMKLVKCIEKYFSSDSDLFNSSDVVRILGNDYVHYENKNNDVSFCDLKTYLEYFVSLITMKIKLKNPPVSRNRQI